VERVNQNFCWRIKMLQFWIWREIVLVLMYILMSYTSIISYIVLVNTDRSYHKQIFCYIISYPGHLLKSYHLYKTTHFLVEALFIYSWPHKNITCFLCILNLSNVGRSTVLQWLREIAALYECFLLEKSFMGLNKINSFWHLRF
jgi:hypothetical protein